MTSSVTSILLQELSTRLLEIVDENEHQGSPNCLSVPLDEWRHHFDLVCQFIEQINRCFGPILLIQTAIVYSLPIFQFNKILLTQGRFPRLYFEFIHTIARFLIFLVIPSYLVTQKVLNTKYIIFFLIILTLFLAFHNSQAYLVKKCLK